jgi:hypothetical protein
MIGRVVCNELQRIYKEAVVAWYFIERLRGSTKDVSVTDLRV